MGVCSCLQLVWCTALLLFVGIGLVAADICKVPNLGDVPVDCDLYKGDYRDANEPITIQNVRYCVDEGCTVDMNATSWYEQSSSLCGVQVGGIQDCHQAMWWSWWSITLIVIAIVVVVIFIIELTCCRPKRRRNDHSGSRSSEN